MSMVDRSGTPRRYVGGIVFDGARVLLGRRCRTRKRYPGMWDIFGGHVEPGESELAALKREMQEELGIEVVDAVNAGTLAGNTDSDPAPFVMTVFLISAWSPHPRLNDDEHDEIRWFRPEALGRLTGSIDERLPRLIQRLVDRHMIRRH